MRKICWGECAYSPVCQKVVDVSYIWTREGWLYLDVVLDLYFRRVIRWVVSNRMTRDPLPGRACLLHAQEGQSGR